MSVNILVTASWPTLHAKERRTKDCMSKNLRMLREHTRAVQAHRVGLPRKWCVYAHGHVHPHVRRAKVRHERGCA
jgi:hypothetical protein